MKRILSLSLTWLLLCQVTQAQSITVTLPDSLAGKNWVKNLVREELKKVGTSPTTPTEPVVKLDPCPAGPIIKSIKNVSVTYLNAQFHGEGVFKIAWWIRDAAGKSVREGEVEPVNNTPGITYKSLPAGNYTLVFQGKSCSSNESILPFTIPGSVGVVVPPDSDKPSLSEPRKEIGAYLTRAGGRTYTYTKSPTFSLSFNSDGTISDITPGIQQGNPSRINGKYIFYMSGYSIFTENGSYKSFEKIYLPDGVYTLRQFKCNPEKIPTLERFIAGINGYPQSTGTNEYNATLSEITLTIRTDSKPELPEWVKVSRRVEFPYSAQDRTIGKKVFAIETLNAGDNPVLYHRKGVHTGLQFGTDGNQPNTFRCLKWGWDGLPLFTDDQLYNSLRGFIGQYGLTPRSIITDEFPENTQGTDPAIHERMYHAYKGALDKFREAYPNLDKRNTGLYGPYGVDDYTGTIGLGIFWYGDRKHVEESLNSKVHYTLNPGTGTWNDSPASYYVSNQIDVRNINASYYMYNGIRQIPYDLLYTSERVKIGSKTYQGKDRESNFIVFSTNLTQTLVIGDDGIPMGVEESKTGEVIPFPGGELTSQFNTPSAAVTGEYRTLGFWSTLLGDGIAIWGSGNYGTDTTKFHTWGDQPMYWTRTGGLRENYQSGVNGSPVSHHSGLIHTLTSTVTDAAFLGYNEARELDDYTEKLSFASYSSSRNSFTAIPGKAGLHLNGRGVLNLGLLCMKDAVDQKAGIALIGEGKSGKAIIYYNGFLSSQEYEDNVTVAGVNIGRVYGRCTAVKKL